LNTDIYENLEGVMEALVREIETPPAPLVQGGDRAGCPTPEKKARKNDHRTTTQPR
jgi:hypothetical protein